MDIRFDDTLKLGIEKLGLKVNGAARERLARFGERLLTWNRKVNLTAIQDPVEIAEKHFLDSLTLLPYVSGAKTLLDIGSGAGLPGMALACAEGDIEVTCCDSVGKKVAFMKAVSAELGLKVRAVATRAQGRPALEGLNYAMAVVSRALAEPARWVPLGTRYLAENGKLFAMLGRESDEETLRAMGRGSGLELEELVRFHLPISGAERAIVRWRRKE